MEKYQGKLLSFTAPSGKEVTIREQNGEDDATLSDMSTTAGDASRGKETLNNYNRFVADIVVEYGGKTHLSIADVQLMPLRDKYYILMKSRIHSNGELVEFEIECKECGHTTHHETHLDEFDTDLSLGNNPDKPKAIELYPIKDSTVELELSSNQRIKYKLMDGKSELLILELGKTKFNRNTELLARELSLEDAGEFVKLQMLNVFGPKAMREIRASIDKNDEQFSLVATCICEQCQDRKLIPLTAIPDFFYPSEI